MTADTYHTAIDALVAHIAGQYSASIAAIYLGGSVARGDHVLGRSDIDLFVVLRERDKLLEQQISAFARDLGWQHFAAMMRYHPQPIDIAFTSLEEIDMGRSFLGAGFEYASFVATGRWLYGEDIIPRIPHTDPERALDIAQFGLNMLRALSEAQNFDQPDPDLAGFLFSPIFRAAALGLGTQGVFVGGKHESVAAFAEKYPYQPALSGQLGRAYALWETWATRDLTREEAQELSILSRSFVEGAYQLWCI